MTHFPVSNHYDRPTVAFDLDGTLAQPTGSEWLGEPIRPMFELAGKLARNGWGVVVHSARPASHNPRVRQWLQHCDPQLAMVAEIACGTKPAADVFVDDKGLMLPPDALEERIYLAVESPAELWVEGTLTDRPFTREWLEVHDNPEWVPQGDDPEFVVVVPSSSGLDSTTVLGMACESGLPVRPVYVVGDAPYTEHEQGACFDMAERVGAPAPVLLHLEQGLQWQRLNGYIDLGRNPTYLWRMAQWINDAGLWGEIWFGNVGEWQESPIRGGDKSHRFFLTFGQILAASGLDVRVSNPLVGLRKADLVRWWLARDRADVPLSTFSCFDTGPEHCGECRACFRRWVALSLGGLRYQAEAQYPHGALGFGTHAKAFVHDLRAAHGAVMSPGRTGGVLELLVDAQLVEEGELV